MSRKTTAQLLARMPKPTLPPARRRADRSERPAERQLCRQRDKRSTRPASRRLTTAALSLLLALVAVPAAQASPPDVIHEQTIHLETETLETVCGDTAVFDFSGTHTFTFVGMSQDVFTWTTIDRATYTVTFQDPSLGVWEGRFTQYEAVHATPGGTFTFSFIINDRFGPVRIHETTTFVVSPDGTIRVQNETFDVTGCPSTSAAPPTLRQSQDRR